MITEMHKKVKLVQAEWKREPEASPAWRRLWKLLLRDDKEQPDKLAKEHHA